MVFTFKKEENDSFLTNDMFIWEFIYENREALSQMLTFMNSQRDQIRHIIINTQDEYFHHLMADPQNGTDNIIPHVYHESNVQGVGLMYRVTDITGIFTVLSNHNFGNQNCKLKINIRDSFFQENNGSYIITFKEGFPEINKNNDFEVEISMDISDFSSMLMGVINFESLYNYGLANIDNVEHIDIVDKLFNVSKKPMCTTGF